MQKSEIAEAELTRYFWFIEQRNKLIEQISDIQYEMSGCKGVGFGTEPKGNSEDRQSKLIRLTEKKDQLERLKKAHEVQCMNIENELHLFQLESEELEIVRMVRQQHLTYTVIAEKIGYANKVVVCRKYNAIVEKIALWMA